MRAFLERHPEYRLIEQKATLPSISPEPVKHHDGGHWAVLMRNRRDEDPVAQKCEPRGDICRSINRHV